MNVIFLLIPKKEDKNTYSSDYPFFLTEFGGKTLIERQVEPFLKIKEIKKIIFITTKEDSEKYFLSRTLSHMFGERVFLVEAIGLTQGALCSALLAIEDINNNDPLIIRTNDEIIEENYERIIREFKETNGEGGILSFNSYHPRYSYISLAEDGNSVLEVQEKKPISSQACAGFYYFSCGKYFVESAKKAILKDERVNGVFYISSAYNELILRGKKVKAIFIDNKSYIPLKNKDQFIKYWENL